MSCKVALYGPTNWAIGSINMLMKRFLQQEGYNVKLVDWSDADKIKAGFEWCDVFITEVHMLERWLQHYPQEYREKGLYVWHHLAKIPGFDLENGHFAINIPVQDDLTDNFFAITKDTRQSAEDVYGVNVGLLPVGIDDEFWTKRNVTKINRIGHVISPENHTDQYLKVKRPDLFKEIGEKSGLEYDTCFGKTIYTGSYIYDGFDAIVNTSTHEGLPTPLLECAAAKIPFISTRVGIVPQYSSIKTFETADEAVEILNELNSDPEVLKKYVEDVYQDVVMNNKWEDIVKEYYVPAIEKIVSNKKKDDRPHLVVSRYNEDVSWIKDMGCHYTLYNKGDDDPGLPSIKKENVGREGATFLDHIIDNYESLEGPIAFLQGDPFDHFTEPSTTRDGSKLHGLPIIRHDELLDSLIKNYDGGVTFIGRGSVCYGDGMPWWQGLEVDEFAERIGVKSDYYAFCLGAQYIVPSEKIKSKSLDWWKNLREIFFEDWMRTGHILERLWFTIFNSEPEKKN